MTGKISALVTEADHHIMYLDDPDSEVMMREFDGLDADEERDKKRKYVRHVVVIIITDCLPPRDHLA